MAFHEGGDAEDMLAQGVKTGMLAAFREWFAATSSKGGGYTNANYESGGGGGGNTGGAARAAKAFHDGGGFKVLDVGADKADNQNASTTGEMGAGGIDRDKWLGQLNANPALRDSLYRHSLGENSDPMANQAVTPLHLRPTLADHAFKGNRIEV
jgi:hypothetical protein